MPFEKTFETDKPFENTLGKTFEIGKPFEKTIEKTFEKAAQTRKPFEKGASAPQLYGFRDCVQRYAI